MIRLAGHGCDSGRLRSRQALCPSVEGLEDRRLLSSLNGGQWLYPIRITYSFMPDGTNVGGVASTLFQKLNSVTSTAVWQQAFQRAAAIWQQVAGINIAQVSDDGVPVGSGNYQQGDPGHGDIRIGGTPMSPGYLAYDLLPPPINGGSDAGDIVINTTVNWKINSDYDLQTVAIHEFGHALGLGHSAIAAADMYAYYNSMKQGLNSDDTTGIQSLYGGVPADPTNNTTSSTAIDLSSLIDGRGQVAMGWGYVTTATDYEWYKVTVPASTTGTMVVKMQTNDLSSLSPRVAVYNSALASLGQAIAVNAYGATVTMTIPNVSPGQVYYFRASAAQTGAGSNGAFGILINFGSVTQAPIPPPYTMVAAQADQGVNGWMGESTPKSAATHRPAHHVQQVTHHPKKSDDQIVIKLGRGRRSVGDALKVGELNHPRGRRFQHL